MEPRLLDPKFILQEAIAQQAPNQVKVKRFVHRSCFLRFKPALLF